MSLADELMLDIEDELGHDEPTEGVKDDDEVIEKGNFDFEDEIRKISNIKNTPDFLSTLEHIESENHKVPSKETRYNLLISCNRLSSAIQHEIAALHKYCKDLYHVRFPELATVVETPVEYARVLQVLGNAPNLSEIDVSRILPAAKVLGVATTAATTKGSLLDKSDYKRVMVAADLLIYLYDNRLVFLKFIESCMNFLAPNLSNIVGQSIAAQLIAQAGGITQLTRLPSGSLQLLGQSSKNLTGFSAAHHNPHMGYIYYCDLVQNAPSNLRMKACRLVAAKCTLAARIDDSNNKDTNDGLIGKEYYAFISKTLEKLQEASPLTNVKPLVIPDDKPKARRGGRRYRKRKEKFAVTEIRKQANRISFGVAENTYAATNRGFGMIGQSGKLRITPQEKNLLKRKELPSSQSQGLSGFSTGTQTSFAFTPFQGIQLENPEAQRKKREKIERLSKSNYFSGTASFSGVDSNPT